MAVVHEHMAPVAGQCWRGDGLACKQHVRIGGVVAELDAAEITQWLRHARPSASVGARFLPSLGAPHPSPGPAGGGGQGPRRRGAAARGRCVRPQRAGRRTGKRADEAVPATLSPRCRPFRGAGAGEQSGRPPVLPEALAWLEARVSQRMECGDHS